MDDKQDPLQLPVRLYMAVSADGFIVSPDGETPWSDTEWEVFRDFVTSCDAVLLGRRTYEIMQARGEFIDGPEYIVVTHDMSADTGGFRKISIRSRADLPQAGKLGVIGGANLNSNLARLGVFDEIILDIEPVLLGQGIRLFGGGSMDDELELVASRFMNNGTVQNHYRVIPQGMHL